MEGDILLVEEDILLVVAAVHSVHSVILLGVHSINLPPIVQKREELHMALMVVMTKTAVVVVAIVVAAVVQDVGVEMWRLVAQAVAVVVDTISRHLQWEEEEEEIPHSA